MFQSNLLSSSAIDNKHPIHSILKKLVTFEECAHCSTYCIFVQVYSVINTVVNGTLHVTEPSIGYSDVNLNEELVRLGFASFVLESNLSTSCYTQKFTRLSDGPVKAFVTVPAELRPATKGVSNRSSYNANVWYQQYEYLQFVFFII